MAPELTIHNPDHLELIMQEWVDLLVKIDDVELRQMCAWIDRNRLEGEQDELWLSQNQQTINITTPGIRFAETAVLRWKATTVQ